MSVFVCFNRNPLNMMKNAFIISKLHIRLKQLVRVLIYFGRPRPRHVIKTFQTVDPDIWPFVNLGIEILALKLVLEMELELELILQTPSFPVPSGL